MPDLPNGKRLLGRSLLDLALILAAVRQSDILDFTHTEALYEHEGGYEDGPLVGILSSPTHHFQQQPIWGTPGHSQKSINSVYDNEYDLIMRNIHSRTPILDPSIGGEIYPTENNRSVVTMVLSLSNEMSNSFGASGGVQLARNFNFQAEGAVGGVEIGSPFAADDNFDIFGNFTPSNMLDAEIDNLMLSSAINSGNNHTFSDVRWQQFISDYDNTFRGSLKVTNGTFGNWGGFDILNEAVQSAELFLPLASNNQNSSDLNDLISAIPDVVTSSRLELIESNEWGSQNHEEDLLFPSLPPPSYEDVLASQQLNSSDTNVVRRQPPNAHMHDHNYSNQTTNGQPPVTSTARNAGFAIRSRSEVSTRVISIPPRPRYDSDESTPSMISETSEPCDLTSETPMEGVERRITTSSDGGIEDERNDVMLSSANLFIETTNSPFYENFTRGVRSHREVVLCN